MAGTGKSIPNPPPKPSPGGNILRWAQAITRYVSRNRIIAGRGVYAQRTESGTLLGVSPDLIRKASDNRHPFKLSVAFDEDGNGELYVRYGTIGGTLDGTYTGEPTFGGTVNLIGDDPQPFYIMNGSSGNGEYGVYAKVTIDANYDLSAGDIHFTDPGDAAPTDTAGTTYYWKIGDVTISGIGTGDASVDSINQSVETSLVMRVCEADDNALWGRA